MKERGLICTAEEVRAFLEERKTQVRRACGFDAHWVKYVTNRETYGGKNPKPYTGWLREAKPSAPTLLPVKCPYGAPGDRLWVREAWAMEIVPGEGEYPYESESVLIKWRADNSEWVDHGDADIPCEYRFVERKGWRPSIHMPRWASRITMEITAVRVERVQDISEEDAITEGCAGKQCTCSDIDPNIGCGECQNTGWWHREGPVWEYQQLWDSLNAKRGFGWDVNPWIWVLELKGI